MIARTPMRRSMAAPYSTRVKTSRPKLSVPKGCARLGACRIASKFWALGSPDESAGANSAAAASARSILPPMTRPDASRGLTGNDATARCARVLMAGRLPHAHARIQERIDQVRGEVDQDRGQGEGQGECLDDHVVAGENGLYHPRSQARQREDGL